MFFPLADLQFLTSALTLVVNIYVAGLCFRAYHRKRRLPFLLLAISCSLTVFTILGESAMMRNASTDEDFLFIYRATTGLWTADLVLFGMAMPGLIRMALTAGADRANTGSGEGN